MADEFDDALGDAIRARSGGAVQISSARHAVIARATQVRRRRAAAVGGVGALAVVGALFLVPAAGDGQVAPADTPVPTPESLDVDVTPPSTVDVTHPIAPSTSVARRVVTPEPPPATAVTTRAPSTRPTGPTTEPNATTPSTTPETAPPGSAPSTSSSSSSSTSSSTTLPSPGVAPFTQQYSSTGGSITVRWDGSALTLTSVDPADGYTAEIEDQSATRIRVRFRGDDDDSRIEVRLRDGVVEPIIS